MHKIYFSGEEPELKFVEAETGEGYIANWSTEGNLSVLSITKAS